MPRGGFSIAKGPRGSRGLTVVLRSQNVVNDDWLEAWGILPGPVVVQVAVVPGRDFAAGVSRVTPLAAPAMTGTRSGAQANAVKSASIVLVETDGGEARAPSLPTLWGNTSRAQFWPRVRIPWQVWSPALWMDPSLLGQLWIAYYSFVFV